MKTPLPPPSMAKSGHRKMFLVISYKCFRSITCKLYSIGTAEEIKSNGAGIVSLKSEGEERVTQGLLI